MLPTDMKRKTNEIVKTAEIAGIRTQNGFIEVQVEFEEGVKSPWMPYCLPFVGGTSIFCYPRIGQGGMILSEGGENEINRFLPIFDTSKQFAGLGEFDFKVLFENGDFIHHKSGNLTINSASTVVVNTQDATVNAKKSTIINSNDITTNGNNFTVNAGLIKLNGYTQLSGGFSQIEGNARSGYTASFTSPTTFIAPMKANVDITINGISFNGHLHNTPAGMSDKPQ